MLIAINLLNDPLEEKPLPAFYPENETGAWVEFRGLVRATENDTPIGALEYEAYQPMAEQIIRQIITEIAASHPCQQVHVTHRLGVVPVGEAAIVVLVAASHRAEGFAMITTFMDRLKQDVPIWKIRSLASDALKTNSSV
jgi:molybdopterin synthase catalytic subunit